MVTATATTLDLTPCREHLFTPAAVARCWGYTLRADDSGALVSNGFGLWSCGTVDYDDLARRTASAGGVIPPAFLAQVANEVPTVVAPPLATAHTTLTFSVEGYSCETVALLLGDGSYGINAEFLRLSVGYGWRDMIGTDEATHNDRPDGYVFGTEARSDLPAKARNDYRRGRAWVTVDADRPAKRPMFVWRQLVDRNTELMAVVMPVLIGR